MIFGTGPEVDALRDLRDAAIEAHIEEMITDPQTLMLWLDEQTMSLADISVKHPHGERVPADEALLWCAMHFQRATWVIDQIEDWLRRNPTLLKQIERAIDAPEEV